MRQERWQGQPVIGPRDEQEMHTYAKNMGWFISIAGLETGGFVSVVGSLDNLPPIAGISPEKAKFDYLSRNFNNALVAPLIGRGRTQEDAMRRAFTKWWSAQQAKIHPSFGR